MLEQDLRPYQLDALNKVRNSIKKNISCGRVVIPTGGGKTAVESFILKDRIKIFSGHNIHLILAPRIALVNQLIKEYRDNAGNDYIALAFHSGNHEPDYTKVKWSEEATTKLEKLNEEFERAIKLDKDLVVFSTYHSADKLLNIEFDTLLCDESQYCVAKGFHEVVKNIKSTVKLFFTATEKHTTSIGRGLNNVAIYGEVIYKVEPKVLIDSGYIVPPRLHAIYGKSSENFSSVVDESINIAKYQHIETTKTMEYSKILFAMNGTEDVAEITENLKKIKKDLPEHDVFTIVSNAKYGAMVNGVKVNRNDFMKQLRESNNALIFHYDILSEGIDIDGITGVSILRNMNDSKLLQTIGRSVRIYKAHPEQKKQALISVTVINNDTENKENISKTIKAIRDGGYDVTIENIIFSDTAIKGLIKDDAIDDGYDDDRRKIAQQILQDVLHELEEDSVFDELLTMDADELLNEFDAIAGDVV